MAMEATESDVGIGFDNVNNNINARNSTCSLLKLPEELLRIHKYLTEIVYRPVYAQDVGFFWRSYLIPVTLLQTCRRIYENSKTRYTGADSQNPSWFVSTTGLRILTWISENNWKKLSSMTSYG
jgi:hypothetical protein